MSIIRLYLAIIVMCLSLAAGCSSAKGVDDPVSYGQSDQAAPTDVAEDRVVRIWSENHPLLAPYDVVLDGCRAWWPNDIDCVLTTEAEAEIRIRVATLDELTVESLALLTPEAAEERTRLVNCWPDDKGARVLAMAKPEGEIEFYSVCFERGADAAGVPLFDWLGATTAVTHEVGHELGIPHVPRSCEEPVLRDWSGNKLCGQAVMNPSIDLSSAAALTEADDIAFVMFAENVQLPESIQSCVLTAE
jgi:hypothetical protein